MLCLRAQKNIELHKQREKEMLEEKKKEKENSSLRSRLKSFSCILPWWFKIVAYVLSAILARVSLFFIVVKGISFGDEKCQKWLTSFMVSILASFLITQPIQVTCFHQKLFQKAYFI